MMVNCAHHLINELKLLKPGFVVFHGIKARGIIRPEFAACGLDLNAIGGVSDRHGPVLYESRALGAPVLFLYHPSRGWLDREWQSVVVPSLDYLRSQKRIPA
jgi:uracil-DNA glycosylase